MGHVKGHTYPFTKGREGRHLNKITGHTDENNADNYILRISDFRKNKTWKFALKIAKSFLLNPGVHDECQL